MAHLYILVRRDHIIVNALRPNAKHVSWLYEREDFDWGAASDVAL